MTYRRYAHNRPSSSGIALSSSTGWFSVHDENGEQVGTRVFQSFVRAAEWATSSTGRTWPELKEEGYRIWGGA